MGKRLENIARLRRELQHLEGGRVLATKHKSGSVTENRRGIPKVGRRPSRRSNDAQERNLDSWTGRCEQEGELSQKERDEEQEYKATMAEDV